jgi:hypothetical protein
MIEIAKHFLGCGAEGKREILDYYNAHCYDLVRRERRYKIKFSDEWCAAFVSAIAHMAGVRAGFPFEVSTIEQVKLCKDLGTFHQDTAQVKRGDLIFFDWDSNGAPNHVGFVNSVEKGGLLTTIEGNYRGTVGYRTLTATSKAILGFASVQTSKAVGELALEVIRGVHGHGEARKRSLGSRYPEVQAEVNRMLRNVKLIRNP